MIIYFIIGFIHAVVLFPIIFYCFEKDNALNLVENIIFTGMFSLLIGSVWPIIYPFAAIVGIGYGIYYYGMYKIYDLPK